MPKSFTRTEINGQPDRWRRTAEIASDQAPADMADEVRRTGATFVDRPRGPMADLELANRRGLNPDHPRHLSRSVVLANA